MTPSAPATRIAFALATTLALVTIAPAPLDAQQDAPRLMSVRDSQDLVSVGSAAISPDGQWVLYTRAERDWDDARLRMKTRIWRVRIDGTDARQLTFGTANTTSPAWFPDGKRIAFLSSRETGAPKPTGQGDDSADSGGNQVFIMYTDGGEAWPATSHEGGVQSFSISPDGATLLLTAQDPLTAEQRRRQRDRDDAVVVDESFRWAHLWSVDIATGKSERLTSGEFVVSDPQWSPDGSTIAYVRRPTTKVDDAAASDVWVTNLHGDGRKFFENAGPDSSPRWSPDGRTLAIVSNPQAGNTQWYSKLYLFPAEGGAPRILLQNFDLDFGTPTWSPDGRLVYWSTGKGTRSALFGVDVASGEVMTIPAPTATGVSSSWDLSKDGRTWVFSHSAGVVSPNLWATTRQGDAYGAPVQLTDATPGWQASRCGSVRSRRSPGRTPTRAPSKVC